MTTPLYGLSARTRAGVVPMKRPENLELAETKS